MIIVKQGAITQYLERESTTLDPGDSVYIDEGVVHASYNDGDETAHLQVVIGPSLGDGGLRARRRLGRRALGIAPVTAMARPVTLFTGQWADLPLEELAAKAGALGLRRPRARVLGRPLRGRPGARRRRLRRGAAASCSSATASACWAIGAHLVGQAVCDPIDARHRGDPAARGLGRRRPGGRAAARRRADEGHGARRGAARRARR